jgi:hypothetical protein
MKFSLIILLFFYYNLNGQIPIRITEKIVDRNNIVTAYKYHNEALFDIHFAVITKVTDKQLKSLEFQSHRWFNNVSILASRVYDYKLNTKMNYISLWIRKPIKKTHIFIP